MSLTTYDGRNLPSVFSDIPSRNEVQDARRRAGRMWIWVLLLFGFLIATGLAAAWLYSQWEQAKSDARSLESQRAELARQQEDYSQIAERRAAAAKARDDLNTLIQNQSPRYQNELRELARTTWRREYATEPGRPELVFPGASQSWPPVQEQGLQALQREGAVMQSVTRRVNERIAQIRNSGGAGSAGGCTNPLNCPQATP